MTREKQGPRSAGLSLEVQLWVEVLLLMAFGLIMVYSASSIAALKKFGDPAHYLQRQLIWIVLGICAMLVLRLVPYRWYLQLAPWLLLIAVGTLALVLVPGIGVKINNARRWFSLRGFYLQPGEYAKVVWVMYLSVSLAKKQEKIKQFKIGFLPHVLGCALFAGLLLLEPDFGTSFLIGVLTVFLLAAAGVRYSQLLSLVPVAAGASYFLVYRVPYRWERITAFLNPWTDRFSSGYQLIQAWIAVGTGGIWGKGLGASHQKLFYLPESYTDFILAVIGEELGFLGILATCVLFAMLLWTGLRISRSAPDLLGALLGLGYTALLSLEVMLNMGVVLGLVPTKGMALPFISYGGSAFTANCLAVGVLMSIARSGEERTR